jgi:hypothetical protein
MNAAIGITISALVAMSIYAGDVRAEQSDWYRLQLFEPSKTQLALEEDGQVMTYDSLRDIDLLRVLDEQFDRVESIMFTGTVVSNKKGGQVGNEETGEIPVENDDC